MDIGTFLLMLAFAYGLGVLWYDLLPGQLSIQAWRVAAYPFAAMVFAQALAPVGPSFGGVHVFPALIASLIGVIIDWIITTARHPRAVQVMESPVGTTRAAT